MFAFLKSITSAANKLAKSLSALSTTVDEINTGLRLQVGLDRPEKGRKVLEHRAAGNGKDGGA
jgi:hypothetical protein